MKVKNQKTSPYLFQLLFFGVLFFSLLLSFWISIAIAHVTDDPSQIHNDEIILSTVQGVYVCCIDLHAALINEVTRWKCWLSDNSEQILLFIHSQHCRDDEWNFFSVFLLVLSPLLISSYPLPSDVISVSRWHAASRRRVMGAAVWETHQITACDSGQLGEKQIAGARYSCVCVK